MRLTSTLLSASILLMACAAPSAAPNTPDYEASDTASAPADQHAQTLTGEWGGQHVALTLTETGGSIQYDCGHGSLDVALQLDAAGAFSIGGTHVREHGGPVRIDEQADSVPARYEGTVTGDHMHLVVQVGSYTLGPFELQRGASARLFRCL